MAVAGGRSAVGSRVGRAPRAVVVAAMGGGRDGGSTGRARGGVAAGARRANAEDANAAREAAIWDSATSVGRGVARRSL